MQHVRPDGSPVDPDATWPKEYSCEINGKRPCGPGPPADVSFCSKLPLLPRTTLPGHLADVQGSDRFRELTPTACDCAGKRPQWVKLAKLESLGCARRSATVPLSATVKGGMGLWGM